MRVFVDTNVLLYAISNASQESAKAGRALRILREEDCALSVQVLQEFYVQATRSSRTAALSHNEAVSLIKSWLRFHIQEHTEAHLLLALDIRGRYSISYWDAAVIAAAQLAGCETLLSEDMAHQQVYGGVRVLNPFIDSP